MIQAGGDNDPRSGFRCEFFGTTEINRFVSGIIKNLVPLSENNCITRIIDAEVIVFHCFTDWRKGRYGSQRSYDPAFFDGACAGEFTGI